MGQNVGMFRLGHLNVGVAELDRFGAFYGRWFGFARVLAAGHIVELHFEPR